MDQSYPQTAKEKLFILFLVRKKRQTVQFELAMNENLKRIREYSDFVSDIYLHFIFTDELKQVY